jgi:zinc finger protein
VRVIRSSTGVIKIPELEIEISPKSASTGYITNVEGVLLRVKSAIKMIDLRTETQKENACAKLCQ